ncbi:hypothetical protein JCM5296_004060 [Sporobolomyces johnsonii]
MTHDILPSIPRTLPLAILDYLLLTLTHRSPFRRRIALVLLVVAIVLSFRALVDLRSFLNPPRVPPTPAWVTEDALAAAYQAVPPTREQEANYARLTSLIEQRRSAYPSSAFREKALRGGAKDAKPGVAVTAVVLHWKRRKGLQLVLKHISRYPFIREVIVWNNRPGVDLTPDDFTLSSPPGSDLPPPVLRIFNSPSNVHDAGKHLACSLAKHPHCYFNDDDWLNIYMDALYTKYLESGSGGSSGALASARIVSNTMPIIHLEHRRWRFENPDIDLHTGFTWLGTGSFFPRALSTRFLQQQSASPIPLRRDQSLVADMFFSLWTNSYPEQWPNDLVPIDVEGGEVGWSRSAGVDQWAVVYGNILSAIRTLYTTLSLPTFSPSTPPLTPHPFPVSPPHPESHSRAPCANDACLFVTSLTPFPDPSSLRPSYAEDPVGAGSASERTGGVWSSWFGRGRGRGAEGHARSPHARLPPDAPPARFDPYKLSHIREHEARFNALKQPRTKVFAAGGAAAAVAGGSGAARESAWPTDEWWVKNGSWHLAVDGKGVETCWESWRAPEIDDHFGLTLVRPRVVRKIRIIGSLDLANIVSWEDLSGGSESWVVLTVRADGSGGWEPRAIVGIPTVKRLTPTLLSVTFTLDPIRTPTTFTRDDVGTYEVANEEGMEVAVRKIKMVSQGRKTTRLRVCGWELDGWSI